MTSWEEPTVHDLDRWEDLEDHLRQSSRAVTIVVVRDGPVVSTAVSGCSGDLPVTDPQDRLRAQDRRRLHRLGLRPEPGTIDRGWTCQVTPPELPARASVGDSMGAWLWAWTQVAAGCSREVVPYCGRAALRAPRSCRSRPSTAGDQTRRSRTTTPETGTQSTSELRRTCRGLRGRVGTASRPLWPDCPNRPPSTFGSAIGAERQPSATATPRCSLMLERARGGLGGEGGPAAAAPARALEVGCTSNASDSGTPRNFLEHPAGTTFWQAGCVEVAEPGSVKLGALRVLVLSDLHARMGLPDAGGGASLAFSGTAHHVHRMFEAIPGVLEQAGLAVDIVLCPGDLADRCNETALPLVWQRLVRLVDSLDARLVATAGTTTCAVRVGILKGPSWH